MLTFPNVIVAMVTPFHEDGSVNYEAALQLAKRYTDEGQGILVGATTGEGATMTADEKIKLYQMTADALKDKTLVMANAGSNDTAQTIEFIKRVEKTGVDAILCIVPYYNKPNQDGCYAHFAAIAKSTDLPIFIYNVPGRTGGKIEAATVCRLANEFSNIIGIKDATGDVDFATEVVAGTPEGFHHYSGDDNMTVPILAVGAEGVISVSSHVIGKEMNEMIQAFKDGDTKKAAKMHQKYLPFMKGVFCTVSPVPVKNMLKQMGLPVGPLRLPLVDASPEVQETCTQLLKSVGKL